MTDTFGQALDQQLRDAITAATDGTTTVTRWILAFEISDGDTRVIRSAASDGATLQDMSGMLRWVTLEIETAINTVIRSTFEHG